MDIQSSKIELAKLILSLDNPEIIKKIGSLLKTGATSKRVTLTSFEKKEIDLAIEMLDRGKKISFKNFLKKVS